ncbi:MAG: hypothetical protein ABI652_05040 [Acidobacteriota bacterium]
MGVAASSSRIIRCLAGCAVLVTIGACGGSPVSPTTAKRAAVLEISEISATVESRSPGTLYRILVRVRETTGFHGATLVRWKAVFGRGWSAESDFTGAGVLRTPHMDPLGSFVSELHVSFQSDVLTLDSQVTVILAYTDDEGHSAETTARTMIAAVAGT